MADWKKSLLLIAGLGSAASGASVWFFDQEVALKFAGEENLPLRRLAREVTDIGEGAPFLVLALVVYLVARFLLPFSKRWSKSGVARLRARAGFALSSLIFSGLAVHLMKFLFGRQRPHMTETFEAHAFAPFNIHWHWHSYPSGHSQVIFAAAAILAVYWPRGRWLLLAAAACVAFTRVIIHQHFLGDVIMGSLVGYVVTRWNYERVYRDAIAHAGRGL